MLPETTMKKRLIACIVLLVALLCVCAAASAADDPVKISMSLSTNKFTEPKTVTVGIQVTNVGEGDMPGPVTLWYPNGKQVEEFGSPTLTVGASKSWTGTWKVTQNQLEAGKITFSIKYPMYNDNEELINKTKYFSKQITYDGAVTSVEINRTITPTTAEKGQEVTVVYEVINTGNTNITDIAITENSSIASTRGRIDAINAGEKKSYTFRTTMGTKNLTSQATITYKVGNKTYTAKKEAITIKYGEVNLKATLAADKKGALAGDTVKLTLTLKNSGKAAYSGITVTDKTLGEVFSGQTVDVGETRTYEKEVPVEATTDYQFEITATDSDGLAVNTATGTVTVTAMTAADIINLAVHAEADRDTVYTIPGTVKFTVSVTNNGDTNVENVSVYATGTRLYTFPLIEVGETRSFTRDIGISMSGQYQFEARAQDKLSQTQTFPSNILRIAYAQPTAVPTEAPIITPPAPVYEPIPTDDGLPEYLGTVQNVLDYAFWVLGGLALLCAALLLFGLVRKGQRSSELRNNEHRDEMDRSHTLDYSAAVKGDRRMISDKDDEEDSSSEGTSDIMRETLNRIYAEGAAEPESDDPAEASENAESESPHRRRSSKS